MKISYTNKVGFLQKKIKYVPKDAINLTNPVTTDTSFLPADY